MRDFDDGAGASGGTPALDLEDPRPRRNRPAATSTTQRETSKSAARMAQSTSATLGGGAAPRANATPANRSPAAATARVPSAGARTPGGNNRGVALGDPAMAAAGGGSAGVLEYGSGKMLGDDPLSESYSDGEAPSLEIEESADPRRRGQRADSPPPPRELTAEEKRWHEVATLAGYGKPPANIAGAMGYWLRVTLRKRELDAELASLSAQRKRTDDAARDALAKLGEALHALRRDPRLATLAKQIEAVSSADEQIGSADKTGAQKKQTLERERAQIDDESRAIEAQAAPLRAREAELLARVEDIKARSKQADARRRKLEQELEALRKKPGGDAHAAARLKTERDALHGEVQNLGIELGPLEDDLSIVRKELSVHERNLSTLQQEQQAAATALERAQQAHRVSSGSARGARRDALSALASAASESGLAALAPAELKAAQEAAERRDRKRAEEELYRAAAGSFDEAIYKQGQALLIGGAGFLLLVLILVVIF
jgi:hypothetical protein